MAWKSAWTTGWNGNAKGMDTVLETYRDLWYRIGTFSMGGYGCATAGLVSGEMLPLAL